MCEYEPKPSGKTRLKMPPTEKTASAEVKEEPVKKQNKTQKETVEKKASLRKVNSSTNECTNPETQGAGEAHLKPRPKKKKPRETLATPNSNPMISDLPKKNAQRAKGSTSLNKTLQGETEPRVEQQSPVVTANIVVEGKVNAPKLPSNLPKRKKKKPEDVPTKPTKPQPKSVAPKESSFLEKEFLAESTDEKELLGGIKPPPETKLEDLPPRGYAPPVNNCSFFERLQQGVKAYFSSRSSLISDDRNKKEGGIRTHGRVAKGVKEDAKKNTLDVKLKKNNNKSDLYQDRLRVKSRGQSSNILSTKIKSSGYFQKQKRKKLYHPKKHYVRIQIPRKGYFYRSSTIDKNLGVPTSEWLQSQEARKEVSKYQVSGFPPTNYEKRRVTAKEKLKDEFYSATSCPEAYEEMREKTPQAMQRYTDIIEGESTVDGEETTSTKNPEYEESENGVGRETDDDFEVFLHQIIRLAKKEGYGTRWNVVRSELSPDNQIYSLQFGPMQPRCNFDQLIPLSDGFDFDLDLETLSVSPSTILRYSDDFGTPAKEETDSEQNFLTPQKSRSKNQTDFNDNYIHLEIHSSGQSLQSRTEDFRDVGKTKSGATIDSAASYISELEETSNEMLLDLTFDPVQKKFDNSEAKSLSEKFQEDLTDWESRLLVFPIKSENLEKIVPVQPDGSEFPSKDSPLSDYMNFKVTLQQLLQSFFIDQVNCFEPLTNKDSCETVKKLLQEIQKKEKSYRMKGRGRKTQKIRPKSSRVENNRNKDKKKSEEKEILDEVSLKEDKTVKKIQLKVNKPEKKIPKTPPKKEDINFTTPRKLESLLNMGFYPNEDKKEKKVFVTVNLDGNQVLVNKMSYEENETIEGSVPKGTSQLIIEKISKEDIFAKNKKPSKVSVRKKTPVEQKTKTTKHKKLYIKKMIDPTGKKKKKICSLELLFDQLKTDHPINTIKEIPESEFSRSLAKVKKTGTRGFEKENQSKRILYGGSDAKYVEKKLNRMRSCIREKSKIQYGKEGMNVRSMVDLKRIWCYPSMQSLRENPKKSNKRDIFLLSPRKPTQVGQIPNSKSRLSSILNSTDKSIFCLDSDAISVGNVGLLLVNKTKPVALPSSKQTVVVPLRKKVLKSATVLKPEASPSRVERQDIPFDRAAPTTDQENTTNLQEPYYDNVFDNGQLTVAESTPTVATPSEPATFPTEAEAVDKPATPVIPTPDPLEDFTECSINEIEEFIAEIEKMRNAVNAKNNSKRNGTPETRKTSAQTPPKAQQQSNRRLYHECQKRKLEEGKERRKEKPEIKNKSPKTAEKNKENQLISENCKAGILVNLSDVSPALLRAIRLVVANAEASAGKKEILSIIEKGLLPGQSSLKAITQNKQMSLKIRIRPKSPADEDSLPPIPQEIHMLDTLVNEGPTGLERVESEYFDALEYSKEGRAVGDGEQIADSTDLLNRQSEGRPIMPEYDGVTSDTSTSQRVNQIDGSKKLLSLIEAKSKNLMMNMEKSAWRKVLSLLEEVSVVLESENRGSRIESKTISDFLSLVLSENPKSSHNLLKCRSVIEQIGSNLQETFFDKLKEKFRYLMKKLKILGVSGWKDNDNAMYVAFSRDVEPSVRTSASLPEISYRRRNRQETEEETTKLREELISLQELMVVEKDHIGAVSQEIETLKNEVAKKMKSLEGKFERLGTGAEPLDLENSWKKATALLRLARNCRQGNSSHDDISKVSLGRSPGCADLMKTFIKAWDTRTSINAFRNKYLF